jgi:subtilisin-like proprotein convertase family protein
MNARSRGFYHAVLFVLFSFGIPFIATADQFIGQVSGSTNDAYAWGDTSQNSSAEYLSIGDYSSGPPPYYRSAFRFTNVTIPQDATISNAYIRIHSRSNFNADWMYLDIKGEDVDDSDSFNVQPYIGQRTLTSATAYWDTNNAWSQNSEYDSPDIGNVIQEIISRSGWSSGNALTIFFSNGIDGSDARSIWSYDGSSSYAAELVLNYEGPTYPSLKPYTPSGWDDIIVVSTVTGTRTDAPAFYANQTLYIDRAWENDGSVDAGTFRTSLYIDDVEQRYSEGSLPAGEGRMVSDTEWTFTTVGWHTLKIVVDNNDDVDEGPNEGDNEYERQIYVSPEPTYPNLKPYTPSGWDDIIVVSTVTGTRTDAPAFYANQTLYIDRAWENDGSVDAGTFRTSLYIDDVEQRYSEGSLPAGEGRMVSDTEWTFTTVGWHTLKIVVDNNDDVDEGPNEGDNEYERQVYVSPEPTYPNLKPYTPSGWDDIIVVSTVTGTRTDAPAFYANQTLYIDRAWENDGSVDAGISRTSLYIDDVEQRYSEGSLPAGEGRMVSDTEWTFTTVGWHTLKIVVDNNDDIDEGPNEGDNEYERQIFVELNNEDPLYPDQWHLNNTGQGGGTPGEDCNVESVWDHYRGSHNEIIAVIDDGLQIAHEDLAPNVIPGMSIDYNVILPDDNDPTPSNNDDNHGTAVAGVSGARGWNGLGVRGVAPEAGLVGYKIFEGSLFYDADLADAWSRNANMVSIYNSSWGTESNLDILREYSIEQMNAIQDGVENGRGGLGCIYVKAAGNGTGDSNGNYNGFGNLRYVISVGATDNNGDLSWYSTPGANVRVNAPSSGWVFRIATTDRTGTDGYNNGDYTTTGADGFGGTSSAAPLVSGVIALMLQANPDLSWRDVQKILMETAEKNDPTDPGWEVNGADHDIHHFYGYGRVDAQAAVNAAETWSTLPAETWLLTAVHTPDLAIPDNNAAGVTDSIEVFSALNIEFVEVYFSASDHPNWGDLEIVLTSPSGSESILAEEHDSTGTSDVFDGWRFGTVRHLDESSQGVWNLTVRDRETGNTGTFETWQIRIFGTPIETPNTPSPILPNDDEVIASLTPYFEWNAYDHPDPFQAQEGFQLRVRCDTDGDFVVYDTGFIADTSGYSHTYTPGVYSGFDPISGTTRVSQSLEWGKQYHWHVRYRDSEGDWSLWSADDNPDPHQDFYTPCSYSIDPASDSYGSPGGSGSVDVTAPGGCSWNSASNDSWIIITSGGNGNGDGTLYYTVSSNSSTSMRTGSMTIAGQPFNVSQEGVSCSYSIDPVSDSYGSPGGSGSVDVTAPGGCSWNSTSNDSWIIITSGGNGNGDGTLYYTVSSNSSTSMRTGSMTIAGQPFNVSQEGVSCSYSIDPASDSYGSPGGSGSVDVTAPGGCSWNSASNDSWIIITSGGNGNGDGTLYYTVSSNSSTSMRTGSMTIAGQPFNVSQEGVSCSYSIDPASDSYGSPGGSGSVDVTAPGGCSWNSASNDSWIIITSGGNGNGDGTLYYTVSSNSSTIMRTGSMTIAGQPFNVSQEGVSCSYSIDPASDSYGSPGGSGSVDVTAPGGCSWNSASNDSWIIITSGGNGNGDGTLYYTVSSNSSTIMRTGSMTIAGQPFNVSQDGVSNEIPWDFNNDGIVNYLDLGLFADNWLFLEDDPYWDPVFNLSTIPDQETGLQIINYLDLGIFADHWLEETP